MMKPCLILGHGNHAKVLLDTVQQLNIKSILGFVDNESSGEQGFSSLPVLNEAACLSHRPPQDVWLLNGVGGLPGMDARQKLFDKWQDEHGYQFLQLTHPSSYVSAHATLGHGVQIMARAVVQTGCEIKDNCLINTGAIIDHDSLIEKHAIIAPGAVLCGNVTIKEGAYVGANATITQGITIGQDSVVAAGAVVISDVAPGTLVKGVPARETIDGNLAERLSQTHYADTGDAGGY